MTPNRPKGFPKTNHSESVAYNKSFHTASAHSGLLLSLSLLQRSLTAEIVRDPAPQPFHPT
jgi:hypothetical protein